jgi:CheY-like chemotaxis protein
MNGTIGFSSVLGQGSTFYLELPRADTADPSLEVTTPPDAGRFGGPGEASGHTASAERAAPPPRILHVEDDIDLSNVIEAALGGSAEVVNAPTLKVAERLLRAEPFSLMVLDSSLPDGNGLSLLDLLPKILSHPMPVVLLSALEVSREVQGRVAAALVKSRVSEAHIVRTILSLVRPPVASSVSPYGEP